MPIAVLKQLSAEGFTSGAEISRRLAISRQSVHNAVLRARELGVEVHAVRGRGYRLARASSWLDAAHLAGSLAPLGFCIEVHDHVDSTNSHLLARSSQTDAHKQVLVAELQTAGRGRRGRNWQAQLGSSLTFSLIWRFNRPLGALSGLSLVVGLGLARALRQLGVPGLSLKWPNDVLLAGGKLAGILIETQGDVLSAATAVIGIGLNVQAAAGLAEAVGQPVATLAEHVGQVPERNDLLLAILAELRAVLEGFDRDGFTVFQDEWQAWQAWRGEEVAILQGSEPWLSGRLVGVDADGALLLDTASGRRRVHSGELSLRRRGCPVVSDFG